MGTTVDMSPGNQLPVSIKVSFPDPYSKPVSTTINEYGIPKKSWYSTSDVCSILKLHPDTFRYRVRQGHYKDHYARKGDKRIYTINDITYLVNRTKELKQNNKSFV